MIFRTVNPRRCAIQIPKESGGNTISKSFPWIPFRNIRGVLSGKYSMPECFPVEVGPWTHAKIIRPDPFVSTGTITVREMQMPSKDLCPFQIHISSEIYHWPGEIHSDPSSWKYFFIIILTNLFSIEPSDVPDGYGVAIKTLIYWTPLFPLQKVTIPWCLYSDIHFWWF